MQKRLRIPVDDIVEDYTAAEQTSRLLDDNARKVFLASFKESMENRLMEFWQMCVVLFRQGEFRTIESLISAEEAYEDFRKLWRVKKYQHPFTNLPEVENALSGPVVAILAINDDKYAFEVDGNSLALLESQIENAIKAPERYQAQDKDGVPYFRGVWICKYLKAVRSAEKVIQTNAA